MHFRWWLWIYDTFRMLSIYRSQVRTRCSRQASMSHMSRWGRKLGDSDGRFLDSNWGSKPRQRATWYKSSIMASTIYLATVYVLNEIDISWFLWDLTSCCSWLGWLGDGFLQDIFGRQPTDVIFIRNVPLLGFHLDSISENRSILPNSFIMFFFNIIRSILQARLCHSATVWFKTLAMASTRILGPIFFPYISQLFIFIHMLKRDNNTFFFLVRGCPCIQWFFQCFFPPRVFRLQVMKRSQFIKLRWALKFFSKVVIFFKFLQSWYTIYIFWPTWVPLSLSLCMQFGLS